MPLAIVSTSTLLSSSLSADTRDLGSDTTRDICNWTPELPKLVIRRSAVLSKLTKY